MAKKKQSAKKSFVYDTTIWNSVGGGFSNPNEKRVCNVGKHKVLVERSMYLNKYGNPVHTATLINNDGTMGRSYRSAGNASMVVSEALKRNGIYTKRRLQKKKH